MTVAAFILSIIAVIVAGASVWYTRDQANSAKKDHKIEAARRHEELTPDLVGLYVDVSDTRDGVRPGVRLTNLGKLDLDWIDVAVIPAHRLNEAVIKGIYDYRTQDWVSNQETGRVPRGESWTFEVVSEMVDDDGDVYDRSGKVQFRCRCHASGHEPWDVLVEVDFPPVAPMIFGGYR